MSARIAGGHDRVVRRAALLDPAGRGERVEIAHILGQLDGVPGGLDPDVRPPGRVRARRSEQVADDLAAARRDGARGVLRRQLLDGLARDIDLLVRGGQAGSPTRWAAWRCASRRAASSRKLGAVGVDLEARHRASTVPRARRHPGGRSCIDSRHVPEDDHGCRARARRRPCARRRAVPRRRQQPRLPRVFRASRGARDERRDADERAARVREHALQAPRRLQAARRRRRLGHAPCAPGRGRRGGRRRLQAGPQADARPPARAVPALPADRRGVRLPEPRVRGLGGGRRDRDDRDPGRRGGRQDLRRLDRPRRVPALLRERDADDDAARRLRRQRLHAGARRAPLRRPARSGARLHRAQGRHLGQHPRHPGDRRQDGRPARSPSTARSRR